MCIGVSSVIVQVHGKEAMSIACEAVRVRMVEVFMPAVIAKPQALRIQLRKDSIQMRDAV